MRTVKLTKKELIIKLIQQDLRHCQLVYGLNRLGLDGEDKLHLQLFDVVFSLMKVPDSIELDWGVAYQKYMRHALMVEPSGTDDTMKPLAVLCFRHLKMMIDSEIEKIN